MEVILGTGVFETAHLNKLPLSYFFPFIIVFHLNDHLKLLLYSTIQFPFAFLFLIFLSISFLIFKMYFIFPPKNVFPALWLDCFYVYRLPYTYVFSNDPINPLLILLAVFLINSLTVKFTTILFAILICYFLLFTFQFGGSNTYIFTS